MKKSILALGAAALFGGLGFAGSAQAVAFFGDAGNDNHFTAPATTGMAQATGLELNPGGLGHVLFVPYYSAQGNMSTMFNITNTDMVNGKAVKVRFRGAANSDDVLDFTVMLSPGDVWSASVVAEGGVATLHTQDSSCTLPAAVDGLVFNPLRLDSKLSADAQALHVNEGYIEILNMADVPKNLWTDAVAPAVPVYSGTASDLYATIKHKAHGTPVCDSTILNSTDGKLTDPYMGTRAEAFAAGLGAPTGQLMASYAVLALDQVATYGGSATAIRAVDATGANARGNIVYSPQLQDDFGDVAGIKAYTGDPLLRNGTLKPLWYDLPDMSTPLVTNDIAVYAAFGGDGQLTAEDAPLIQADTWLANALSKGTVINDWIQNDAKGWQTDWVVSQPTRRYYAAVDYSTGGIVWNADMTGVSSVDTTTSAPATALLNRYRVLKAQKQGDLGTYACMQLTWTGYDREENSNAVSGSTSASPGAVVLNLNCGEVYTITFGNQASKVLQAKITNQTINSLSLGEAGWGVVTLGGNLPAVGFSATSAPYYGGNIGYTIPHRWN